MKRIFQFIVILLGLWLLVSCATKQEYYYVTYHAIATVDSTEKDYTFVQEVEQKNPVINKADYVLPIKGYMIDDFYFDNAYTKKVSFPYKVTNDIDIYVSLFKTYIVTYMVSGQVYQTFEFPAGFPISAVADPTSGNKEFLGWYTDSEYKNKFDYATILDKDITLYAKFKEDTPTPPTPDQKFSVTYVINGHGEQPTNLTDQTKLPNTLPVLSAEGWTFDGWYTDEALKTQAVAGATLTANTTLYAKWTKNDTPTPSQKFSITYVINGHGKQPDNLADQTKLPATLPVLSETGWTFGGWYTDEALQNEAEAGAALTTNVTLYAKWTKNDTPVPVEKYSVTYVINGHGKQPDNLTDQTKLPNTLPTLSETGWIFDGWYTDSNFQSEAKAGATLTANATLYAKWTKENTTPIETNYNVTFNSDGGSSVQAQVVKSGNLANEPTAPTKTGYKFGGWYLANTQFDFSTPITNNIELKAHWTPIQLKVTFVGFNDTLITEVSVNYNSTVTFPTAPTQNGYSFKGWSKKSNAFEEFLASTKITEATTIYAYYEEIVYQTVTFNVDGTKTQVSVESGKTVSKPANPTKEGLSFVGWFYDNTLFDFNTKIEDDIELVARFAEMQIEITKYSGYNEGLFFEATPIDNVAITDYIVKYKLSTDSSWKTVDKELVRLTNNKVRCDIIGLVAGEYDVQLMVGEKLSTISCTVTPDDRSGYAHFGYTNGIGAYNDDGTLKSNAVVVYVTDATKNTVKAKIGGKDYTGLVKIIQACTKESYALDIRILGEIQTTQWNAKSHGTGNTAARQTNLENTFKYTTDPSGWDETTSTNYSKLSEAQIISKGINSMSNDLAKGITQLTGLTNQVLRNKKADSKTGAYEYDSYYNMLDVASGYNITIEGIGTDASIFQWGFAFKKCNSIEIKNIRFHNYTEDAVGFEGGSSSDNNYGNYWVHNCTFDIGVNNWDVCYEADKGDGDGSSDVKYCHNVTISYTQYNGTHKTNLIGSGDSALQYNITLHHNYYNKAGSRLPLIRQANIHIYNNYYYGSTSYSHSIRANCYAFVENNYYDGGKNPYETLSGGVIKAYNNIYNNVSISGSNYKKENTVSSRTTKVTSTCMPDKATNGTDYSNFDTNPNLFYYDATKKKSDVSLLLETADVPQYIKDHAGTLKANVVPSITNKDDNTPEEPEIEWTTVLSEDFSSSKTITQVEQDPSSAGIYYMISGGAAGSVEKNNLSIKNGSLKITDDSDATTYGYYMFDSLPTTGKVKISIDFTPETSNGKWTPIHFLDGGNNIGIRTNDSKVFGYVIETDVVPVGSQVITVGTTYTIELLLDYSTNTAKITINDKTVTISNYSCAKIKGIMFQTAGSASRSFSVDNIVVETAN
ncbi:MAG: InlB B-repeat-containing protein [Anaeroplasmataceae bacterium]|nr:InlB B-repeat-containing protein [Anaeroplasmataceae bacterium]